MSSSAPFPMIDAREVLRKVGGGSFARGQTLVTPELISTLDWDGTALSARVAEGGVEHACSVDLAEEKGAWVVQDSACATDPEGACLHCAALLIASNKRHRQEADEAAATAANAPVKDSGWKQTLERVLEAGRGPRGAEAPPKYQPMALQFELQDTRDGSRRQYVPGQGATHARGVRGRWQLAVRPMVLNAEDRWVRGNLRWNTISFKTYGLALDPEQHRWFCQFVPLYRANGELYFGEDNDWLLLDDFSSALIWPLLREADKLGISLIGSGEVAGIELQESASVGLEARREGEGDLMLEPVLHLGERRLVMDDAEPLGTVGRHGAYAMAPDGRTLQLAPTETRIDEPARHLVVRPQVVTVPAEQIRDFFSGVFSRLARRVSLTSPDGSVELPVIQPPVMKVTTQFRPDDIVALSFDIDYGPAGIDPDARDRAAEDAVEQSVLAVLAKSPALDGRELAPRVLQGLDTVDFVRRTLPALEALADVRIEEVGTRPAYRELTEAPELTVTTVESEKHDWFDLGLIITVGGRQIPYADILRALSQGQTRLLMSDKTYVSLEQPLFEKLRALVTEASQLTDSKKDPLRITRYQVSLWEELESLATTVEGPDSWHAAISGLANLGQGLEVDLPSSVDATLRPYQLEGFRWLASLWEQGLGGILADDMGLGKTLQMIALLAHMKQEWDTPAKRNLSVAAGGPGPVLVVAPTSVVPNWLAEIKRFSPNINAMAIRDTQAKAKAPLHETLEGVDVVVTSYTLFRLDADAYQSADWAALVLDEAQFVKNKATKAHHTARDLRARVKLAITGTPMENNLMELWALLAITSPGLFPSSTKYAEQYSRPIERGEATTELERLRKRVRPFMLRRTKDAVVTDLPSKQEQVLKVELSEKHRKIYDTHLQHERQKVLRLVEDMDRNRFTIFQSLTLLRLLALDAALVDDEYVKVGSAKLDVLQEHLEALLPEGHRALVFSQFTSFLRKAAERLDASGIKYAYLDGSTRRREDAINEFKEGDAPVFLISLKAGGFGLNLTEADYCFLLDPWWNPAAEAQAVDRAHRIGQTRNVMVYRLVSEGTIEEKVVALQDAKRELISSVMDGGDGFGSALTAEDIRDLLSD
ncbi:SNF2-related protein [Galactobacter valiniphilus]|uniref:SNF2-related protein n=1 Tax=Galactobacter valiniphilus TaxID=2676122 RepID=UPI00373666C7